MLGQSVMGGAEPPSPAAIGRAPLKDRSMQVLEYLVATVAAIAALVLAFLR
jgi:hypothetical protein